MIITSTALRRSEPEVNEVFADTSYWIALVDPRDQYGGVAREARERLKRHVVLTSEWVFAELLNTFSGRGRGFRGLVAESVQWLRQDPQVIVEPATSVGFSETLLLYSARLDKGWSFTDCASMLLMEQRGISQILSHDRHFEQAGFRCLLRK